MSLEYSKEQTAEEKSFSGRTKYFDKERLEKLKPRVNVKKKSRIVAKEEEKNYVEFRKMQVLYDYRPTTEGAFVCSDTSFPRKRSGVSMGFGERKAYFLSSRPNPKYATWFGKKTLERKAEKNAQLAAAAKKTQPEPGPINNEEDELLRKGKNSLNPLIGGRPFWVVNADMNPEDELEDDSVIVDIETIEKVCEMSIMLKDAPSRKKKFNPFDDIKTLNAQDPMFEKQMVFSNTARSVLTLIEDHKRACKPQPPEVTECIVWSSTMTTCTYSRPSPSSTLKSDHLPLRDNDKLLLMAKKGAKSPKRDKMTLD